MALNTTCCSSSQGLVLLLPSVRLYPEDGASYSWWFWISQSVIVTISTYPPGAIMSFWLPGSSQSTSSCVFVPIWLILMAFCQLLCFSSLCWWYGSVGCKWSVHYHPVRGILLSMFLASDCSDTLWRARWAFLLVFRGRIGCEITWRNNKQKKVGENLKVSSWKGLYIWKTVSISRFFNTVFPR